MGDNSVKNSRIKTLKPHAQLHIIGRKSSKFQMNPMKDVKGVVETTSGLAEFKSAWAITPSKNSQIKILKPHTNLHIIGWKSTKFQANPIKDVVGVAETRSLGQTAGRKEGRTDGRTDRRTDGQTE